MNLELLKKLVRLANNNPNDNEANLAARKVCKMIEEAQFKFTTYESPPTRPIYKDTNPNYRRYGGWHGFDRSAWDAFYQRYTNQNSEETPKEKEAKAKERSYDSETYTYSYYDEEKHFDWEWFDRQARKKQKFDQERVCSKCGLRVRTFKKETPFVCGICVIQETK